MAGSLGLLISFAAFVSEMLSGKTRTKSKESKKTVAINKVQSIKVQSIKVQSIKVQSIKVQPINKN
jgi:hypothetical protein